MLKRSSHEWRVRVREARRHLGLTQDELAHKAGVSKETIRSYESGRRLPDRDYLVRVLEAAELPRLEANAILQELGFAPIRELPIPTDPATWSGSRDAQRLVDQCPWPAFAINNLVEVVAANSAFEALFDVDLARELPDPSSRSLLALATTPRFVDRVKNWDEAVATVIAVWKYGFTNVASLDDPTPYVSKMLESAAAGDPSYLRRMVKIWEDVEPIPPIRRWFYPIVWRDDELGTLRLQGLVHTGDDPETLISFNDWIPIDAATWSALEGIRSRRVSG